jgi:hypothetical protein
MFFYLRILTSRLFLARASLIATDTASSAEHLDLGLSPSSGVNAAAGEQTTELILDIMRRIARSSGSPLKTVIFTCAPSPRAVKVLLYNVQH